MAATQQIEKFFQSTIIGGPNGLPPPVDRKQEFGPRGPKSRPEGPVFEFRGPNSGSRARVLTSWGKFPAPRRPQHHP